MPLSRLVATVLFAILPIASATAEPAATTGAGGGPASTTTAPNTSSVGRTMPPAGAGTADERPTAKRNPQQTPDEGIQKGICIGCSPN